MNPHGRLHSCHLGREERQQGTVGQLPRQGELVDNGPCRSRQPRGPMTAGARIEGPSENAASETHPQTAVASEVVALMEGVLLLTLANKVPAALTLDILLRFDGPVQVR